MQDRLPSFAAGGERREVAEPAARFRAPPRPTSPSTVTRHAGRPAAAGETRAMRHVRFALLAVVAAPQLALAQGSITGTVRDSAGGTPLAGVAVTIVGTELHAATDAAGRYAVAQVPAGPQRLRARRLGFAPGDTAVVVQEGMRAVVDLRLRASAVELEAVVTVGDGEQRKATLAGAGSAVGGQGLKGPAAGHVTNTHAAQPPRVGVNHR